MENPTGVRRALRPWPHWGALTGLPVGEQVGVTSGGPVSWHDAGLGSWSWADEGRGTLPAGVWARKRRCGSGLVCASQVLAESRADLAPGGRFLPSPKVRHRNTQKVKVCTNNWLSLLPGSLCFLALMRAPASPFFLWIIFQTRRREKCRGPAGVRAPGM